MSRRVASKNAVSFSSARTTKRFPSPRCASAIKIVRPSRSIADTQPKLHPRFLRLSAMMLARARLQLRCWFSSHFANLYAAENYFGKNENGNGNEQAPLETLGGRTCPFCGAGPPRDPLSRSPNPTDDSWWCPNCRRFYPTRAYKSAHPDCWEFAITDKFWERHGGKIRKRKTKPID